MSLEQFHPSQSSAPAPDPVLDVRDLRVRLRTEQGPDSAVVDGASFALYAGETYALVGESGSGKTLTALSLLRLLPEPACVLAGGRILFEHRDLAALGPAAMRRIRGNRISMIFQEPMTALNPVFTVGAQIDESVRLHRGLGRRAARRLTIEALREVGLPDPADRADDYPHQLSGGMRQRAMIAMALVCRPRVLIADEPTTALDVTIQAQILALIRAIAKERDTAVLLITHDMGVVRENADRIGVMYAGRLVEEAARDPLFAEPAHPYTRLLLRSIPSRSRREHALAAIPGRVPPPAQFPTGCRFHTRCPFVMDRCRVEAPPFFPTDATHRAACFLLDPAHPAIASSIAETPTPAPSSPLRPDTVRLAVRDLKAHFPVRTGLFKRVTGHVKAVDGVDLTLHEGETLALVGESGCGKTTVAKTLVGLMPPNAGSILYGGRDLAKLSTAALKPYRRRIQMIFQDPFSSLNPRMTVHDIVAEGMSAHQIGGSVADRVRHIGETLALTGLDPEMMDRYPHEFSGGQRQRIGLARALALNPELIVCDEAVSSLDVSVQAQILNLLKTVQSERGLSYLFITHDLGVVEYLADRVAVMYLGRIVEEGGVEDIFRDARHPYTQALLAAVPQADPVTGRRRIVLKGDVPSPSHPPTGCHFHPRCPQARPECEQRYPDPVALGPNRICRCILARNDCETP